MDFQDQMAPTDSHPNALSISECGKSGTESCAQEWREMPLPASPIAVKEPIDGVGTSVTVCDATVDTLWLPRSSPGSGDTPWKIQRGFTTEKEMGFLTCCRQYPKAVFWSLVLFLTVVMEAYDKSLIAGFLAFPVFRRKYGQRASAPGTSVDGEYEIPPGWQMGLQNAAVACEIVGLLAHGYITYIIGYRKVMIGSLVWLCIAVFPAVFARSITTLLISQALSGTKPHFSLSQSLASFTIL